MSFYETWFAANYAHRGLLIFNTAHRGLLYTEWELRVYVLIDLSRAMDVIFSRSPGKSSLGRSTSVMSPGRIESCSRIQSKVWTMRATIICSSIIANLAAGQTLLPAPKGISLKSRVPDPRTSTSMSRNRSGLKPRGSSVHKVESRWNDRI
ncbi:hypothetical protein Mapa_001362 [Marchantia paleacea]|nr:hypothetical protein Mapa_001362 [Marchantia paleacea]